MGFDAMSVEPTGDGDRIFTAVPTETEPQRKERLEMERRENIVTSIAQMENNIAELQEKVMSARADLASAKE